MRAWTDGKNNTIHARACARTDHHNRSSGTRENYTSPWVRQYGIATCSNEWHSARNSAQATRCLSKVLVSTGRYHAGSRLPDSYRTPGPASSGDVDTTSIWRIFRSAALHVPTITISHRSSRGSRGEGSGHLTRVTCNARAQTDLNTSYAIVGPAPPREAVIFECLNKDRLEQTQTLLPRTTQCSFHIHGYEHGDGSRYAVTHLSSQ